MASQYYEKGVHGFSAERNDRVNAHCAAGSVELGPEPFNRDNAVLAFGRHARVADGQKLAGTGALVFEGEILEIPAWH